MKIVIEPGRAAKNYWRDIWRYRELSIPSGRQPLKPRTEAFSLIVTVSVVLLGVWYFRRMERTFADVI
jgi:hypothetical protein